MDGKCNYEENHRFMMRFLSGLITGMILTFMVGGAIFALTDLDIASSDLDREPSATATKVLLDEEVNDVSAPTAVPTRPVISTDGHDRTIALLVDEVINDKNTELVPEIFAPNYIGHLPQSDFNWDRMTIDTYLELPLLLHASIPDIRVTPEIVFVSDDWVVMRGILSGTFQSELYDISPTRDQINISFTSLYRFNDENQIAEEWISYDTHLFVQQFGLE
jgi:predicted ester cyclase